MDYRKLAEDIIDDICTRLMIVGERENWTWEYNLPLGVFTMTTRTPEVMLGDAYYDAIVCSVRVCEHAWMDRLNNDDPIETQVNAHYLPDEDNEGFKVVARILTSY